MGKFYSTGKMQELQKTYTAKGVIWLSVASSAAGNEGYFNNDAEAKAWESKEKALPTSLLRDPEGTLGQLYGAKTTPHMFVIDAKGKLAYKGALDDIASADPSMTSPRPTIGWPQPWIPLLARQSRGRAETKP